MRVVTGTAVALCMGLGLLCLLRAAHLFSSGSTGRFRFDPWVSLVVGYALMLLGQYLLHLY